MTERAFLRSQGYPQIKALKPWPAFQAFKTGTLCRIIAKVLRDVSKSGL
jgi:hypothetical protein